ncbi:MAG: Gfo/Idh/MocA family oxidoreductase [Actinomycetota bacterium]|nr:Gfo/Idh/MocA family oxidoreductase [Actinomycetota bacterium]
MIGIAVIGAGHWGPNLIRNFHNHDRSEVRVVCERDGARLAQVASRFPDVEVTTDVSVALADPGVDAAVIATPTSTHFALASAALAAGRHVLVEKPLAARSGEGAALCEAAEAAGRVLMVGHVFLYNAGVQRVRRYLEGNELGRLYYLSMTRTNLGPIRMDVDAAWDLAAHDVSIANWWLDGPPLWASARGGTWINTGIEDAVFATLGYRNDVLVHLHVSWLNPRKTRDITIVGERRMLTFDDMNLSEPIRIYDKRVTEEVVTPSFIDTFASFRASVREGDITIPKVAMGEPLKAECDHFLDCVEFGKAPLTGGRDGLAVVDTLEAIERSVAAGGREEPVVAR